MKRAIIKQLSQLSDRQQGYVAGLNYRYMNLCVKAEMASLIPVEVMIEGEANRIEDVAYVGQKEGDDYSIYIIPKYEEDIPAIGQAVAMRHPEFKQEIGSEKVEVDDENGEQEVNFLRVIMPEVDDDRRDVLKDATDLFYDQCKADMEAAQAEADAQIAVLAAEEKPADMDEIKKNREKINDTWNMHRDKLHEAKLKEIEDAYRKWVAERNAANQKQMEKDAAQSQTIAKSMRITPDNDE